MGDNSDDDSDIGELNCNNRPVSIDKYGFIMTPEIEEKYSQLTQNERRKIQEKETTRTKKWSKMLKEWDKTITHKESKLKSRIRKGIPDIVRGEVWKRLAGIENIKSTYPNVYHQTPVDSLIPENTHRQIECDLDRTFPRHDFFVTCNGAGQSSLRRILHLYAIYDPEVGYCSGMGFVAGTFVIYMIEEDALYALISIMHRPSFPLREMYKPGMPGTKYVLSVFVHLLHHYLPSIASHLEKEGITPHMYVTEWFMTLYTSTFPFELVTTIFDILWYEGWKIIYRVALGLLKYSETVLLASNFEEIILHIRALPQQINCQKLWKIIWDIPLKRQVIESYGAQHLAELHTAFPDRHEDTITTTLDTVIT